MKKYFVCVGRFNEGFDSIVKATVKAYRLAVDYFPCHICDGETGEVLAIFTNDGKNVVVNYK